MVDTTGSPGGGGPPHAPHPGVLIWRRRVEVPEPEGRRGALLGTLAPRIPPTDCDRGPGLRQGTKGEVRPRSPLFRGGAERWPHPRGGGRMRTTIPASKQKKCGCPLRPRNRLHFFRGDACSQAGGPRLLRRIAGSGGIGVRDASRPAWNPPRNPPPETVTRAWERAGMRLRHPAWAPSKESSGES